MNLSLKEAERLLWMIDRNDWLGILGLAKHFLRVGSSGLLKKYKRAIERVESHFKDSFSISAWSDKWLPDKILEHRRIIAWFCREFGSAGPLIADITLARKKGLKPRSLVYFMVAEKGRRASRWDLLLSVKRKADWEMQKNEENRCGAEIFTMLQQKAEKKPLVYPMHAVIIRAATTEFNNAVKSGNLREATGIKAKVISLTGIDISKELNLER